MKKFLAVALIAGAVVACGKKEEVAANNAANEANVAAPAMNEAAPADANAANAANAAAPAANEAAPANAAQ